MTQTPVHPPVFVTRLGSDPGLHEFFPTLLKKLSPFQIPIPFPGSPKIEIRL
jgi:hypothetical protein